MEDLLKLAAEEIFKNKPRGPMQDFLDAVKEAKSKGQQFVVHEHVYPNLFEGTPMGTVKGVQDVLNNTIDTDYKDVTETKLLDK